MKLKNLSTPKIRRELARRESGAKMLQAVHAKVSKRLAALEAELADLGVDAPVRRGPKPGRTPGRRGPGRPKGSKNRGPGRPKGSKNKNAMSLVEAILSGVRAGSTVSPAEAGAAAKKVGYKSSSPNFGMMVANALSKDSRFKRLERGQYRVGGRKPTKKAARKGKRAGHKPGKAKVPATTALAEVVAR